MYQAINKLKSCLKITLLKALSETIHCNNASSLKLYGNYLFDLTELNMIKIYQNMFISIVAKIAVSTY